MGFWAQTLDAIAAVALVQSVQAGEADTKSAKMAGLMCPAVVELVCEALGSSGRAPERLITICR